MINKKDLKNKKNSIKYINKITKSMEMISISKYKFFSKNIVNNNKYINNILKLINNIDFGNNIFFKKNKDIKNILYIVISTNQGLCSNININLYKKIILNIKKKKNNKKKIYFFLLGNKNFLLLNILKKFNIHFKIFKENIFSYNINNYYKNNITDKIINFYKKKNNITIFVSFNIFKEKKYIAKIDQLLPIYLDKQKNDKIYYLYESNKYIFHDNLLFTYISSKINNCLLNNIVSEYYSRVLVMKNASLNSENLFKKLDLIYNKIRQFNITKEIIELISNFNIF